MLHEKTEKTQISPTGTYCFKARKVGLSVTVT